MDKLAQERSWWNKRREQFGFLGKTFEGLSPEFKKTMEKVRKVDERTRDLAVQTRDLLKSAKKFFAKRDYLSTVAALSEFHKRTRQIASDFDNLRINIDEKQYRALLEQYDDDQKEQLFGYDPKHKIEPLKEDVDDGLSVEASDWWFDLSNSTEDVNFARERSRVMKAFERLFTVSFFQKLKQESAKMLEESEMFQKQLLSSFKLLDRAMSKRKLADYLGAANDFVRSFGSYHDRFVRYHEAYVKPLKEHHGKMMEERKAKDEKDRAEISRQEALRIMKEQEEAKLKQQSLETLKQRARQPSGNKTMVDPQHLVDVRKEKLMYEPTGLQELSDASNDNEPIDLTKQKAANEEFLDRLEVIAEEDDPRMMVLEILDRSEELEGTDPEASLKLLSVAEGIIDDYKTAGIFDFLKGKPEEKKEEEEEPIPLA